MAEAIAAIGGMILVLFVLLGLAIPLLALGLVINLRYKVTRLEEKVDLLQRRDALSKTNFDTDDDPPWRAPVSAEYPEPLAPHMR